MPDPKTKEAIKEYSLRLGDDALILGHRLSEWCSRGPFLEEDVALTNVALDFLGRARMFYSYAAELADIDGVTEDTYAYNRDCRDFCNLLICELPGRDFAFSMARQYLIDEFDLAFMQRLRTSADPVLAAIAGKATKECVYHLRRSRQWMLWFGDGTTESHGRLQWAINDLWGYTAEFFELDDLAQALVARKIAVDTAGLKPAWQAAVAQTLTEATITVPVDSWSVRGGHQGVHTEHLGHLLSELQFMQRAYPGLAW